MLEPSAEPTTRESLLASWRATQRRVDESGPASINEAAYAGKVLELADEDPEIAITMLPFTEGPYWGVVHAYLERVAREDRT